MDKAQLDDLKQFITVTVSQTEKRLEGKISDVWEELGAIHGELAKVRGEIANVQGDLAEVRSEMADGFAGIAEALETTNSRHDKHEAKTDMRLTKLEANLL
jgi:predicted  nucleic acid-binding Zn-ribbon protein